MHTPKHKMVVFKPKEPLSEKEIEQIVAGIKNDEVCGLIDADDGFRITWNLQTTKIHNRLKNYDEVIINQKNAKIKN